MHTHTKCILLVGLAGGSGSGKTYAAKRMQEMLGGPSRCQIFSQDNYYKDLRQTFEGDGSVNYDHPDSIDFDLMAEHLEQIACSHAVWLPQYDFAAHARKKDTKLFIPTAIVIVEGILVLSQEKIRRFFDYSLYLNITEKTRLQRRIERDISERGRTEDGVKTQFFQLVAPMHDKFVQPSKVYAHAEWTEGQPGDIADFFMNCSKAILNLMPYPHVPTTQKTQYVENLFDKIAPQYDFLNRFLSFRQDVRWRHHLLDLLPKQKNIHVQWDLCDLACGTGDVLFTALAQRPAYERCLGIDVSSGMLQQAVSRMKKFPQKQQERIAFLQANAEQLPIPHGSVGAVTIAFGLRNIDNRQQALQEMYRVLSPGGHLCVLEFFTGTESIFYKMFYFYFHKILPKVAGYFSWKEAYQYLPHSVASMPHATEFLTQLKHIGFSEARIAKSWLWGGVRLVVAKK